MSQYRGALRDELKAVQHAPGEAGERYAPRDAEHQAITKEIERTCKEFRLKPPAALSNSLPSFPSGPMHSI